MSIFILDFSEMFSEEGFTKEELFDYIRSVMRTPDYMGNNLDALADVLSEYSENDIIILMHTDALIDHYDNYGKSLITVFKEESNEAGFALIVRK